MVWGLSHWKEKDGYETPMCSYPGGSRSAVRRLGESSGISRHGESCEVLRTDLIQPE